LIKGWNQKISVIVSVVTVSMTAATYLFYQHLEYENFDASVNRNYIGLNDPSIINTLVCSFLYVVLIAPRIWANALTIALSPKIAFIMFSVELVLTMAISHKYASQYASEFPGKMVTAIFNSICPCTPIGKSKFRDKSNPTNAINFNLAKINLASCITVISKILLLYPIVIYQYAVEYDNNPDRFRCWNKIDYLDESKDLIANDWNANTTKPIRLCGKSESPNQLLFEKVIPLTIMAIVVLAVPSGFLISLF